MLITLLDYRTVAENQVSRKEIPVSSKIVLEEFSFLCSKNTI
jgi:hypothetical protein